jgi:hypothetical protein
MYSNLKIVLTLRWFCELFIRLLNRFLYMKYGKYWSRLQYFFLLQMFTSVLGALVAQWLALLTSDLEGPGSNPG